MSALDTISWRYVRTHYDERERIYHELLSLRKSRNLGQFTRLLLGISDPAGNYSAAEHGLGPKILSENANAESRSRSNWQVYGSQEGSWNSAANKECTTSISTNRSWIRIGVYG